jgi:biopolymer transport protein ExbB
MFVCVMCITPPADAQDGTDTRGNAREAESFAERFFFSTTTDVNGERSIEVLGTAITWLLLALSVASLGLIGMMALTNQRKTILPDALMQQVDSMLKAGRYREVLQLTEDDESFFSQVLHAGLREANYGYTAIIRALEQTAEELTTMRLRRVEYLNVLGQVSPMIGLFGTVYGMILAFQAIVIAGGNADPVLLAGGISTALTTTFWGLVVAIPALAGYAVVRNKIDAFTSEATLAAEEMLVHFRPKPRAGATTQKDAGAQSSAAKKQ